MYLFIKYIFLGIFLFFKSSHFIAKMATLPTTEVLFAWPSIKLDTLILSAHGPWRTSHDNFLAVYELFIWWFTKHWPLTPPLLWPPHYLSQHRFSRFSIYMGIIDTCSFPSVKVSLLTVDSCQHVHTPNALLPLLYRHTLLILSSNCMSAICYTEKSTFIQVLHNNICADIINNNIFSKWCIKRNLYLFF